MKKILVIMSPIIYTLSASFNLSGCSKPEEIVIADKENSGGNIPDSTGSLDSNIYISKYGKGLVYYAEVDKAGNYFRRMFIDSASARIAANTGVLPSEALLVLETWFGSDQSTVYIRQKKENEWHSNSFSPSNPIYQVSLTASCNSCHATASVTDDAFTLPLLKKALARGAVQKITCKQPSFTPCDLSVYQGN